MAYYSDYNRKNLFNLSIEQYAKLLDISPRTLERYEYEMKCPDHIKRFQDVIQCYFITYSSEMNKEVKVSEFIEYYFDILGITGDKRFKLGVQ